MIDNSQGVKPGGEAKGYKNALFEVLMPAQNVDNSMLNAQGNYLNLFVEFYVFTPHDLHLFTSIEMYTCLIALGTCPEYSSPLMIQNIESGL